MTGRSRSHRYGASFESPSSRRNFLDDDDRNDMEKFREFEPYLKRRLQIIKQSRRDVELREEVEDITYYLDVMSNDFGIDQVKSFTDKIHDLIRKNPLADLQNTVDTEKEHGVTEPPQSHSPQAGRSDTSSTNTSSIPTHPIHETQGTVDVNLSAGHDRPQPLNNSDDEWHNLGEPNNLTSQWNMRPPWYGSNSTGIGEDTDFGGAREWDQGVRRGGENRDFADGRPRDLYEWDESFGESRNDRRNTFSNSNLNERQPPPGLQQIDKSMEEFFSKFERRQRSPETQNHLELGNSPPNYNHNHGMVWGDFGRENEYRHDISVNSAYPPHATQPPMHYPSDPRLQPRPSHHPLPNTGMYGIPNYGVPQSMNYGQRGFIGSQLPLYHGRPPHPEHYHGVPSTYNNLMEPSADRIREISISKAKQCFSGKAHPRRQNQFEESKGKRVSRAQELRKQVENEGLFKLGRPMMMKDPSFKSKDDNGITNAGLGDGSSKSSDKSKNSTHPNIDKHSDGGRSGRSQNKLTGQNRGQKKGTKSKLASIRSAKSSNVKQMLLSIQKSLGKGKRDENSGSSQNSSASSGSEKQNSDSDENVPENKQNHKRRSVLDKLDEELETSVPDELMEENMLSSKRTRKQKLQPTKANRQKLTKRAGPATRAQAALKNSKKVMKKKITEDLKRSITKKKITDIFLRRIVQKRIGQNDTLVNTGMCKIKIEPNTAPQVKSEPVDPDDFSSSNLLNNTNDQSYLADQLDININGNIDNSNSVVVKMEKDTEDNMD